MVRSQAGRSLWPIPNRVGMAANLDYNDMDMQVWKMGDEGSNDFGL